MVVALVPFGASAAETDTVTAVATAEQFAAMTDGDYVLTAPITLPDNWKAIDFAGTLNGNGYVITVSKNAPVFNTVTGTVKNVYLAGDMTLTSADVCEVYIPGDINGYGLGVLANQAIGATINNVTSNVNVTFTNDVKPQKPTGGDAHVSFGLIGFASAAFTVGKVVEGEKTSYPFTIGEETIINKVTVNGTMNADFVHGGNRQNMGIIVGSAMGCVKISKCVANAKATCSNSGGNKGGIIGHVNDVFTAVNPDDAAKTVTFESKDTNSSVTDSIFSGEWTTAGSTGERFGGIVGYARGFRITSSAVTGKIDGAGNLFGVWGYANANGGDVHNEITNTIFVGQIKTDVLGSGASTIVSIKKTNAGATLICSDIYRVGTDKLHAQDETAEGKPQIYTTKDYADAASAVAAFVADNDAFEIRNNTVALKYTIDTPDEFAALTIAENARATGISGLPFFYVTADLDMKGVDFVPFVNLNTFNIDFQGHTVSNLVVETTEPGDVKTAGLFANVVTHRQLNNFKLDNCLLIANGYDRVGLVVGRFDRGGINGNIEITNCTAKVTFGDKYTNRFVTALIGANDYEGQPVIESLTMKNIRLESENVNVAALYTGVLYNANYTIKSATIENVTLVKGDVATAVEAQKCYNGYNNVTFPDATKVTVTNNATATGYVDPTPVVPDPPVDPAPTGDMTIALVTVALVSLAAVTVIAKKKVNE